jgi:putative ATP-dependent endonuclease of the OLD family
MKIESVRIENFRGFHDETIILNNYTCFVGPNGAGKSTILTALNIFFRQYKDSKTDLSKLSAEDFHHKNIKDPIRITVTFCELSEEAKTDLANYVRLDKLVISAIAKYDAGTERAEVCQFGNRMGMEEFRVYFEAEKRGEGIQNLKEIYSKLRKIYSGLADAKTKQAMAEALQNFESINPKLCVLIPSEDQFYGATRGANKLAPHLQWVFVPAVKDITEESQESKTSGLGQLLARTVRSKVDFSDKVKSLKDSLKRDYQSMLDAEQSVLDGLSGSIEMKLKDWAHPAVTAKVLWTQDADRSIKVDEPWAYIRIGERGFEGELARFGHGMQRSFMLTLLQEIASSTEENVPTLILAIEEPELYQHPPQARYLSELLHDLACDNSQIIICSHSPLFIPGDDFETVRVVRDSGIPSSSSVSRLSYSSLADILSTAGQSHLKEEGMLAKLYPSLNPNVNEMFFCRVLILVEGIEDVAYLSTYLSLLGLMQRFRKCGCHIVPVGGKSEIIKPLAMAKQLDIPVFVIIDADTNTVRADHIVKQKKDNKIILSLMNYITESEWPSHDIWKNDFVMWSHNLTQLIENEIGSSWQRYRDNAESYYGQPGGLQKNPLAISRALDVAWNVGEKSTSLEKLAIDIISFSEAAVIM